jgi:hypothetical protein
MPEDSNASRINISGSIYGSVNTGNIAKNSISGDNISGDKLGGQKQTLTEAAYEIQRLLKQLEDTNPSASEVEQVAYINIATNPALKQRILHALEQSGEATIEEFIQENKYLKVMMVAIKNWTDSNS